MQIAVLCALLALALPAAAQQSAPPAANAEPGAPPDPPAAPPDPPAAAAEQGAAQNASPESFESSEEISTDLSVSYPVDI